MVTRWLACYTSALLNMCVYVCISDTMQGLGGLMPDVSCVLTLLKSYTYQRSPQAQVPVHQCHGHWLVNLITRSRLLLQQGLGHCRVSQFPIYSTFITHTLHPLTAIYSSWKFLMDKIFKSLQILSYS